MLVLHYIFELSGDSQLPLLQRRFPPRLQQNEVLQAAIHLDGDYLHIRILVVPEFSALF